MNVSIRTNHDPNVFGVSVNLNLTELCTILCNPMRQGLTSFSAVLNPTTFALIHFESTNVIKG